MKKIFLVLLLVPGLAFAGGDREDPPKDVIDVDVQVEQDQAQDQDQDQSQQQSMGGQENSQTVIFTSPDDVTIRNVASANPPNVSSSHACALGKSGGIGIPAVNVSGGKQKIDLECVRREEARLLNALGERELAVIHLCNSPGLVESLGQACAPSVTQEELRRRIEFLLKERERDQEVCNDSKDRILDACEK